MIILLPANEHFNTLATLSLGPVLNKLSVMKIKAKLAFYRNY